MFGFPFFFFYMGSRWWKVCFLQWHNLRNTSYKSEPALTYHGFSILLHRSQQMRWTKLLHNLQTSAISIQHTGWRINVMYRWHVYVWKNNPREKNGLQILVSWITTPLTRGQAVVLCTVNVNFQRCHFCWSIIYEEVKNSVRCNFFECKKYHMGMIIMEDPPLCCPALSRWIICFGCYHAPVKMLSKSSSPADQ